MVEVLGLQGDVGHDVAVVDHSYYGGHSALEVHREVLVSHSRTPEGMNFLNSLVLQLQLQSSYHRNRSTQTSSKHLQPFFPIGLFECFQGFADIIADGEVGEVEALMNLAVFTSWVIHLFEGEVLHPIDRVHCPSEDQHELVQAPTVPSIGHDGGYLVFADGHAFGPFQNLASLAGPAHELLIAAVRDDGVALEALGER